MSPRRQRFAPAFDDAIYLVERLGRFGAIEYARRQSSARWTDVLAILERTDARQARAVIVASLKRRSRTETAEGAT